MQYFLVDELVLVLEYLTTPIQIISIGVGMCWATDIENWDLPWVN